MAQQSTPKARGARHAKSGVDPNRAARLRRLLPGTEVLVRLRIGDRMQIASLGLGLRLVDWPELAISNCAPRLSSVAGHAFPLTGGWPRSRVSVPTEPIWRISG